ncbi:MAG: hypothetical protein KDK51_03660, partial [Deltaproteobacteria bacterium]|nr:hypothetical protein [Deltaproteobacteria bacterium]
MRFAIKRSAFLFILFFIGCAYVDTPPTSTYVEYSVRGLRFLEIAIYLLDNSRIYFRIHSISRFYYGFYTYARLSKSIRKKKIDNSNLQHDNYYKHYNLVNKRKLIELRKLRNQIDYLQSASLTDNEIINIFSKNLDAELIDYITDDLLGMLEKQMNNCPNVPNKFP